MIKELFHLLSVFNFNIEITAPECSIPDFDYKTKWFGIMGLPLLSFVLFLLLHVALWVNKRFVRGQRRLANSHVSTFVATGAVMMYFLCVARRRRAAPRASARPCSCASHSARRRYLYLTRTTLDVFNCAPTNPSDGHTYLEVVFERCGEEGGLQMTLLPFAFITLALYVAGYPAAVFRVLHKNRMLVMEDQLLRAKGQGDDRLTNPHAHEVRRRYHKLYYHFRPDRWYWILAVLGRKFLIAFTSLMFNKNPAFQLSMALLVMFSCYSLQVKYRPYMSPSEREDVLAEHQAAVVAGNATHITLEARLADVERQQKKKARAAVKWGPGASNSMRTAQMALDYFWNYNTVEMVLLGCAVLVNLAGVMFESGKFEDEYYHTQRDTITILVLMVIVISILYFFTVFASEVWTTVCVPARNKRAKGREKRTSATDGMELTDPTGKRISRASKAGGGSARGSVFMGANPMAAAEQGGDVGVNPLFAAQGPAETARPVSLTKEEVSELLTENNRLRQENQRLRATASTQKSRRAPNAARAKREFRPHAPRAEGGAKRSGGKDAHPGADPPAGAAGGASASSAKKKSSRKKAT